MSVDNQTFFDRSIAHMLKQGRPAANDHPVREAARCAYHMQDDAGNDLYCAIGGAIPCELAKKLGAKAITARELIDPDLAHNAAEKIGAELLREVREHLPESSRLAMFLQAVHDSADLFTPQYIEISAHSIAKTFGLRYTP